MTTTLADHTVAILAAAGALDLAISAAADAVLAGDYNQPEAMTADQLDAAQLWVVDHLEVLRYNATGPGLPTAARALAWLSQTVGEPENVRVNPEHQPFIDALKETRQ